MLQPSQLVWIGVALVLLLLGLSLGNVVLLTGAVFVLLTALLATALAPPSGVVVGARPVPRNVLGRRYADGAAPSSRRRAASVPSSYTTNCPLRQRWSMGATCAWSGSGPAG